MRKIYFQMIWPSKINSEAIILVNFSSKCFSFTSEIVSAMFESPNRKRASFTFLQVVHKAVKMKLACGSIESQLVKKSEPHVPKLFARTQNQRCSWKIAFFFVLLSSLSPPIPLLLSRELTSSFINILQLGRFLAQSTRQPSKMNEKSSEKNRKKTLKSIFSKGKNFPIYPFHWLSALLAFLQSTVHYRSKEDWNCRRKSEKKLEKRWKKGTLPIGAPSSMTGDKLKTDTSRKDFIWFVDWWGFGDRWSES